MWKALKNLLGGNKEEMASAEISQQQDVAGETQPPEQSEKDLTPCYEILGLEPGADLNSVRRAWKEALKEVHMGHYADDPETKERARQRTQQLNDAYHTLRDELF